MAGDHLENNKNNYYYYCYIITQIHFIRATKCSETTIVEHKNVNNYIELFI